MVEGGPIDFLTGDYLAELTMMILWKARQTNASRGYAVTFLKQMEDVLGEAIGRGIKIVTNAGGLNPAALATELCALCDRLGLKAKVLHIEGDDLLSRLESLQKAGHDLKNLDTGQPLCESAGNADQRQCLSGLLGHCRGIEPGSRHCRLPASDRRLGGRWSGGLAFRLAEERLGQAGRRRRRRACAGVRRPVHRRQLFVLPGGARVGTSGLPDRGNARRRIVRDYEARRNGRTCLRGNGHGPVTL